MTIEEIKSNLCYYDRRNPDFQITEENGYDKEDVDATGDFARKNCSCDNCFYGRAKLAEELLLQISKLEEIKIEYFNKGISVFEEFGNGTFTGGVELSDENYKKELNKIKKK